MTNDFKNFSYNEVKIFAPSHVDNPKERPRPFFFFEDGIYEPLNFGSAIHLIVVDIIRLYTSEFGKKGTRDTYFIRMSRKLFAKNLPYSGAVLEHLEKVNPYVRMSHKDDILCIADYVPDGYVEEPKLVLIKNKLIPYDLYKYSGDNVVRYHVD